MCYYFECACYVQALSIGSMLDLPSEDEKRTTVKEFMYDLKSYHVEVTNNDTGKKEMKPVICSVCDSIAKSPKWASWVNIGGEFCKYCKSSNLCKERLDDIYKAEILQYYSAPDELLEPYILSPDSIVDGDKILVCNNCLFHMRKETGKRTALKYRRPPKDSIANGYLIGEAPEELKCLNEVELVLVSKIKIHSYIWIYFAGCHQQIRGWHTFYKNRPTANISSMQTLQNAGLKGNILVVLCGPFTETQKAITMEATRVRPEKVIAAFQWLVRNNYFYTEDDIPDPNELPHVEVITEDV